MRILDVRHEQTAVFAAEATARLRRTPGLAVLTAGPGVTNGMSAITTAHFNGSPWWCWAGGLPTTGGARAACRRSTTRCCSGDHQAGLDRARHRRVGPAADEAFRLAGARHRGPVFLDMSLEALFGTGRRPGPDPRTAARRRRSRTSPTRARSPRSPRCWPGPAGRCWSWARTCGWTARTEAARAAAEELRLPVIANGQGRGILPAGHELLVTRARSVALRRGRPGHRGRNPARLPAGLRRVRRRRTGRRPAQVVHVADAPASSPPTASWPRPRPAT